MSEIAKALGRADPEGIAAAVRAGRAVPLALGDETVELLAAEIDVQMSALPGLALAEEGGTLVALSTELTPELEREGIARDISRSLNNLRREADYKVSDRIVVEWSATEELAGRALTEHRGFIEREALAVELREVARPSGDKVATVELDGGATVTLAIRRH
jgi:isoleucyl-tRNA synthetase